MKYGPRLRRLVSELTPPILTHLSRSSAGLGRQGPAGVPVSEKDPRSLKYYTGYPVFSVPMKNVRYSFGQRYTNAEHHFLRYYNEGTPALRRFFEAHTPSNIFELYFLKSPNRPGIPDEGDPWFAPAGLGIGGGSRPNKAKHGAQSWGPVSEQKLALEARRLDEVLDSISKHGYQPRIGGYPLGHFMFRATGEWVFTIRGGYHRTAALAHLGYESIDAQFHPRYPRSVDEREIEHWPMVRNGCLSDSEARSILAQFFKEEGWRAPG